MKRVQNLPEDLITGNKNVVTGVESTGKCRDLKQWSGKVQARPNAIKCQSLSSKAKRMVRDRRMHTNFNNDQLFIKTKKFNFNLIVHKELYTFNFKTSPKTTNTSSKNVKPFMATAIILSDTDSYVKDCLGVYAIHIWNIQQAADETSLKPPSDNLLKIGVYYETLCPDSREFIRNSLFDAMVINDWLEYTDLEFVPYGKVTSWTDPTTNITTLFCQHGHSECEQNALHACIVEHNDIKSQVQLISCLMRGHATSLDECASELIIDVSAVKECKSTRSTSDILKKYGDMTDVLDISFVPSVTFDGKFDRWRQRYFIYNFSSVFCEEYKAKFNIPPPHC